MRVCTGVSAQSTDSLVFEMLIPKPVLQRYVSLLQEHRRLILSGASHFMVITSIVLYYSVLYFTILFYALLWQAVLGYALLYFTIL